MIAGGSARARGRFAAAAAAVVRSSANMSRRRSPAASPRPRPAARPLASAAALPGLVAVAVALSTAALALGAPTFHSPRLTRDGAAWRVELDGRSTPLALEPGARVESVVRSGGGWLAVGTRPSADGGRELWLRQGPDGERPAGRELVPPPGQQGRTRERPVALVAGDSLVGLAWLEGDTRRAYDVRWAAWLDGGFTAPEVISPRGPGSQLALVATLLDDGRALLVWSGYDGSDDEIWSSVRGRAGGWSKPARVGADDRVPDVTPTVVAVPGGALVAWSRYDTSSGEYRLALARWTGAGFDAVRTLGEPGALAPRFERGGAAPWLSWRDARADRWTLGEIGPDDALLVRATAAGEAGDRPDVEWPGPGTAAPRFAPAAAAAALADR
jgi:hypothetical protein